jgi:hypothetical protein
MEIRMFSKTIAAVAPAVLLSTTVAAVAQGWRGGYGHRAYDYGFGYATSGRTDPTNTNGN